MRKDFCDKCGKEVPVGKMNAIETRINTAPGWDKSGHSDITKDLCDACYAKVKELLKS